MLYTPPTNLLLLAAEQEPCKTTTTTKKNQSYLLTKIKILESFPRKKKSAERASGQKKIRRKEYQASA